MLIKTLTNGDFKVVDPLEEVEVTKLGQNTQLEEVAAVVLEMTA